MDHIRMQNIDGRDRRIFKCDCGTEIFFIKKNTNTFEKRTIENKLHSCEYIKKFEKTCFDCSKPIRIYKKYGRWQKEELDGTIHSCGYKEKVESDRYWCHDCDTWHYRSHGFYSCVTDNPNDDDFDDQEWNRTRKAEDPDEEGMAKMGY